MSVTSCDSTNEEQDAIINLNLENSANDSQKKNTRGGKNQAKLEYSVNEKSNRPSGIISFPIPSIAINEETLSLTLKGELSNFSLIVFDNNLRTIIKETIAETINEKTYFISPAVAYPYYINISNSHLEINGTITLVNEDDEE